MKRALIVASVLGFWGCAQGMEGSQHMSTNASAVTGTITVGGHSIPRIADPPVAPPDQAALDNFMGGFLAGAVTDFRNQATADAAVGLAVPGANGHPIQFGDVALVRPGLGNILFSPAQVFLLAQHFGTVIVMYTNRTDPTPGSTDFKQVTQVAGVSIPAALQGKIRVFTIGSPTLNLITYLQQSDVSLEQLEILHQRSATLGFDVLTAHPWMLAHSQGVNDSIITQHRLESVGIDGFKELLGVAGAVKGGRLIESSLGQSLIDGATAVQGAQGAAAMEALGAHATSANLIALLGIGGGPNQETLLDNYLRRNTFCAFGGVVDPNAPQGNVRAAFLFFAGFPDGNGQVLPNDGVEDTASTLLGKNPLQFNQVDHILITEDPNILHDELVFLSQFRH